MKKVTSLLIIMMLFVAGLLYSQQEPFSTYPNFGKNTIKYNICAETKGS